MYEYRARVARVIDGDTYELEIDLGLKILTRTRVRLRGVDTPETFGVPRSSAEWRRGSAARAFVEAWFEQHGPELVVRTYKDRKGKFGRYLVDIEDAAGRHKLGEALLAAGHAQAS